MNKKLKNGVFLIFLVLLVTSCGDGSDSPAPVSQTDYSGTYCHGEFNKLIIDSTGGVETYSLIIGILGSSPFNATGSRVGENITLNGNISGYDFAYDFTFSNNANNVSGQINISDGVNSFLWNEYGTKGDCPTIDIASSGVPQFINTDFVDLANDIEDISLFRSAAGHDYSDSFESCRSMKHYFAPPLPKRVNNMVPVYSPINGQIVNLMTEEDNFTDDGVTNQKVLIKSSDYPELIITIFHIDLSDPSLAVGANLVAGQQIGFARMVSAAYGTAHDFDIAIHASTPNGIKYVSYFDTMTDSLFSDYINWGGGGITRSAFIISQAERDADPLTCSGETFTSFGNLQNWYYNLP
jgi:hypothetical protein